MTAALPLVPVTGGPAGVRVEVPVQPDAPTAEQWLRDELGKPEYHPHENPVDWVVRHVSELLDRLTQPASSGNVGTWIVVVVVAAVVVGIVLLVGPLRRRRRAAAVVPDSVVDASTTAEEWRRRSERAWSEHDWSGALAASYRGLVQDGVDRVLVEPWPGLTAHEAAASLGRHLPDHAARAASAASLFDAVCYGSRPATRDQAQAVRALAEEARQARPRALSEALPVVTEDRP